MMLFQCKYIDNFPIANLKRWICSLFLAAAAVAGSAQQLSSVFLEYIDKYKHIAIRHCQEYGIPASITLAQGLLESGAGRSALAKGSNNHFGIKCHDWEGERTYVGAATAYNCYRKYESAEEGYEDHARFLKRSRYQRLYDIPVTDYKAWARGLKACGYAENPTYAEKLIRLIETYELHQYDTGQPKMAKAEHKHESAEQKYEKELDQKEALKKAFMAHDIHRKWHKYYIVAKRGDTYESIALEFNKKTKEILDYNDITDHSARPREGERVWVERKHERHPEVEFYVAKKGETLHAISQEFGMRMKNLYRINHMKAGEELLPGQKIFFR
ncbi:MAG: glucosaminidase domain-containing protein [Bacteroidales bacterium]|nr:glucosaminidase domain-containing protein [Bacteroidales bacterium]